MDHTQSNSTRTENRIISLCTGSGGIEQGIKEILPTLRTVAYVEVEAFINYNLVQAMEAGAMDTAPIWTDVKTFDGGPFRGKIHGLTGGYPCQPFSMAGKRKGKDDPRHLFPHICRIIEAANPLWCFFENVEGHLSMGYDEVYRSLRGLGYTVEAGLFSAAEFGASQVRQRLFILAVSDIGALRDGMPDTNGLRRWVLPEKRQQNKAPDRHGGKVSGHTDHVRRSGHSAALPKNKGNGTKDKCRVREHEGASILPGNDRQQESGNEKVLADTNHKGPERYARNEGKKFPPLGKHGDLIWPAPPGHPQHGWEAPRIIESGVGCTVNGYNFRRDILRMLGNGVVWQCAAKAFCHLLLKQIENFSYEQKKSRQ